MTEKGNLVKTQTILNTDSVVICKRTYNNSDQLTSEFIKNDGNSIRTYFDKNGEVASTSSIYYNADGKIIKSLDESKHYNKLILYNYEGDLIVSSVNAKGRHTSIAMYEYEFYE